MLSVLQRDPLPIDIALARKYFRLYDQEHDSVIQLLMNAAVTDIERYTRQTFVKTRFQWLGNISDLRCRQFLFPRFPVIELVEVYSIDYATEISLDTVSVDSNRTPPLLESCNVLPANLRITWDAGHNVMPDDLKLLVLERAFQAFEYPGSETAKAAAQFNPQHRLMLEGYCTQHDAVR